MKMFITALLFTISSPLLAQLDSAKIVSINLQSPEGVATLLSWRADSLENVDFCKRFTHQFRLRSGYMLVKFSSGFITDTLRVPAPLRITSRLTMGWNGNDVGLLMQKDTYGWKAWTLDLVSGKLIWQDAPYPVYSKEPEFSFEKGHLILRDGHYLFNIYPRFK